MPPLTPHLQYGGYTQQYGAAQVDPEKQALQQQLDGYKKKEKEQFEKDAEAKELEQYKTVIDTVKMQSAEVATAAMKGLSPLKRAAAELSSQETKRKAAKRSIEHLMGGSKKGSRNKKQKKNKQMDLKSSKKEEEEEESSESSEEEEGELKPNKCKASLFKYSETPEEKDDPTLRTEVMMALFSVNSGDGFLKWCKKHLKEDSARAKIFLKELATQRGVGVGRACKKQKLIKDLHDSFEAGQQRAVDCEEK
jgi:hypothetical protein